MTPTLNPSSWKIVDFFSEPLCHNGWSIVLFMFAVSTGKLTSCKNGTKPSTPKSNS